MTPIPVAVLTNGTLLYRKEVRKELLAADLVVPSLDAATAAVFRKVNRPHRFLKADRILDGLRKFRKEYSGRIWLEIMLVKGVNDSPKDIRSLKRIVEDIRPDRVHLNTVVRPPADSRARPLSMKDLERIRVSLGDSAEIVASPGKRTRRKVRTGIEQTILDMVRRRPVTLEDISLSLGTHRDEILKVLAALIDQKKIRSRRHGRKIFYRAA
jgi:wyosine [tRNA(Phe)-imidazoG37] synthetase (radical SAM superfamily)